ncbi:hypothetical protein BAU26_19535 [Bacillus sp. N35-10-4]|uniref:hypothetical protein n=1 Tax=Bacillus sp. N35-10-4 TaxID=1866315 RepID=UPI0008FE1373|nr:hypothetical protein [Bacillus sp. N35-10-4]OJD58701.1 hypothetical protein BAU26_19535 [Bacillus sp. N35-10-4]
MYKVEENTNYLRPYHQFMCNILKALRKSLRENVNYSKGDLSANLVQIDPNVRAFINRGNFLDNIYKLKDSPVDLWKEYGAFVRRYKSILHGKWKGISELTNDSNREIKKVFIFFYEELMNYKTFNEVFFHSPSSLTNFRTIMSLHQVCPYCDMNKINKELVSVDHFLPKAIFPILSIYPENLIVSCKGCNENIKGENVKIPIAHPYYEEVANHFTFQINDSESSEFKIDVRMHEDNSNLMNKKIRNFLLLFEIKERYERNMTAELIEFRNDIRKKAIAELEGISQVRSISYTDIEVCTKKYFQKAFIDNRELKRAVDGTKIKNDYINQIIEGDEFHRDIEYIKSYFDGLRSILI